MRYNGSMLISGFCGAKWDTSPIKDNSMERMPVSMHFPLDILGQCGYHLKCLDQEHSKKHQTSIGFEAATYDYLNAFVLLYTYM